MKDKNPKPNIMGVVWRHWKIAFKKNAPALLITITLYNIAVYFDQMLKPIYWKKVFDSVIIEQNPNNYIWAIIFCMCVAWILNRSADYFVTISESSIIKILRDNALYGLMKKDSKFFTENFTGSLITKAKRFSVQSEPVIDQVVFTLSKTLMLVVCILVFSFINIPSIAPIFLGWTIVFTFVTVLFSHMRLKTDLAVSEKESYTSGVFSDIVTSIIYLRSFAKEYDEFENFKKVSLDEQKYRRKAWLISNAQWATQSLLVSILELFVMYILVQKVLEKTETLGTLAMVQIYVISLAGYMYQLGQALTRMRTGLADAYEMASILDEKSDEHESVELPKIISGNILPKIIFENVNFIYKQGGVETLKNFSFNFKEGRHYGIVGHSGAGKSTLFKVLLRMYDHMTGKITVSGNDVKNYSKATLRSLIAYVPQQPHFPSRKVIDILKLGKENASEQEAILACEKAGCQFIWEKLPNGFETFVGERGVKLSGGEAQRLAIATAILKDAPIVIMDEPTSSLDAETEMVIQQSITKHFVGKTMLVIAHRLATVAVLDEILLIENGTVAHSAPHAKMLKTSKVYANMWHLQTRPGENLALSLSS